MMRLVKFFIIAFYTINMQNKKITTYLSERFGERYFQLPIVLRLLLDNVVRHETGAEQEAAVAAIFSWLETGRSTAEIPFRPGRVLMHDTTSTPALVDIAAMRDAIAEVGLDPNLLNPQLPVDVSVDHSLAVEVYAKNDAAALNLKIEMRRNNERYQFLRWASNALTGVRIHPPGTGIMHTLHLEQLAKVVIEKDGELMPDVMLGTDSHTPMVNGIGVLGWGVGGLEAQTVMFGLPTMLRIPDVVGVELVGKLQSGVQATDLALVVTNLLRSLNGKGLSGGEFVEYFGAGVSTLSAGARCVIANMAPEYGATTGYFAVDDHTLSYLRGIGHSEAHLERIRTYTQAAGLWFDPSATPRYTQVLTIDLGTVSMHVAGPTRPQDLLGYGDTGVALRALTVRAEPVEACISTSSMRTELAQTAHPVAIAAITSCTNTTDPRLLVAARALGLSCPPWVKTSLAPGSPAAASYLKRAGLLADLEGLGFGIVGYGCTTCIGNPGPLTPEIIERQSTGERAVAILSGNRNFPGRVHPDIELSFIMSPALVIAFGLAGDGARNLQSDPVQVAPNGQAIYLRDIWPSDAEIDDYVQRGQDPLDYARDFRQASKSPLWLSLSLASQSSPQFKWDVASTALRPPPFAKLSEGSLLGHYRAYPLLVLGDDVTTDHISPASAIPPHSLVADFLVSRGDSRDDLNVFASRRGNWEVMMRAAFHNKTLKNLLAPHAPVAHTLHQPSGAIQPIWDVAASYAATQQSTVIVAGERYGMGSSRDWAAKGQRLLGVRAVLAMSFERIHRSNLIGMGILPLVLSATVHPNGLKIQAGDQIEVQAHLNELAPRGNVSVIVHRKDGSIEPVLATAGIETQFEIDLLRDGGVIPYILKKTIRDNQSL